MLRFLTSRSQARTVENVEYVVRHCAKCAAGDCDFKAQYEKAGLPVPSHGAIKPVFQTWRPVSWAIKNGLVSPHHKKNLVYGRWAKRLKLRNLVVTAGKAGVASRINGSGGEAAFTSIGFGTGTNAAAAGDTALQTGVDASGAGDSGVHVLPTASVTASRVTTTVTNDTAQLLGTVSITGTIAITESGVFNADTNGTMLARQVFSAINVVSGDSLQLTWKVAVSA